MTEENVTTSGATEPVVGEGYESADAPTGVTGDAVPEETPADDAAVFASATDPDTVTKPSDPAPEPDKVDDAEASFASHTDPAPGVVLAGDTSSAPVESVTDYTDGSQNSGPAPSVDPVGDAAKTQFPVDLTGDPKADAIAEIHALVKSLRADMDSVKVLAGELAPTFEKVMDEAKERGLAGMIPLILNAVRGK